MTKDAAAITGLKEGTPIAAGAGDQAAASIGVGAVSPGDVFDSAGTASVFSFCVDQFKPDLEHRVVLASHGVAPATFYALSFINGGGLNLRWFRDNFGALEKRQAEELNQDIYQLFDRMAEEVPPGAGRSLFMPHLQGRVLPPDASLRGLWVGFTWGHSKAYLFRAILEAVAFEYAYYLEIEKKLQSYSGMLAEDNPVIYQVYEIRVPEEEGHLLSCTTVIYPGKVGNEYFFTKGHYHVKEDRAEIYTCLQGEGYLLMTTREGGSRSVAMKPGTSAYIPPYWSHRTLNSGQTPAGEIVESIFGGESSLADPPAGSSPAGRISVASPLLPPAPWAFCR